MNDSEETGEQIKEATSEEGWTAKDALLGVIVFVVIVAVVAGAYLFWQARKTEPVEAGSSAPDFTLPLLNEGELRLSDYRRKASIRWIHFPEMPGVVAKIPDEGGTVVMLNIWATTCVSCREEFPAMEYLYRDMKEQNLPFEMLASSTDKKGAEQINPFINDIKVFDGVREIPVNITFPILLDSEEEVFDLYDVNRLPETYIIDKNGIVRDHILGPVNWNDPTTEEYMLIQHLVTK